MLQLLETRGEDAPWMDEVRRRVTTLAELEAVLRLTDEERRGVGRALEQGLPLGIAPYYLGLADRHDPRCPIRMQCVPHADEARPTPGDLVDPLGEVEHTVAPNLVRRYPDRALLLVTDRCSVYCRFCTRSRMVGQEHGSASMAALEPAMSWLEANPEVREVIVSGGDPLVAATARIEALLRRLRAIPSIEHVRIATRAPVTLPMRITEELCRALRRYAPLVVMTHFNHGKELTPEAGAACERLVDAGIPVLNQTVLLRGVNSCACVLEDLFRGLVRRRVRPYYLLQCDTVAGAGHFRTAVDTGIRILETLQGRLSGVALPKLVLDVPGGYGKVPIGPEWLVARSAEATRVRTWRGAQVDYPEPAETDPSTPGCRCVARVALRV
jgi:lysine 2,3-aminomutase